MPDVEFIVKNKSYSVACKEGEEEHIQELAGHLNSRVNAMAKAFATASDSLVMAITALTMEDEINTLKQGKGVSNGNNPAPINESEINDRINEEIANAIEPITQYVETLANKLENS